MHSYPRLADFFDTQERLRDEDEDEDESWVVTWTAAVKRRAEEAKTEPKYTRHRGPPVRLPPSLELLKSRT